MPPAPFRPLRFPSDFWWGTASAGHQVEGGNLHSNWWAFEQQGLVNDGSRSGRACDYWNRYPEDHSLMRALGLNSLRLGVEWARIEPAEGRVDASALSHYRSLLEDARANGLRVCLTLHHWVLPLWLAERGGWEWGGALGAWEAHVRRVVGAVGDLVDLFVTLNEPMVPVLAGYLAAYHPPCRRAPLAAARVFEALLRAHAIAYRVVHAERPRGPGGTTALVGFASAYQHVEPYHEGGLLRLAEAPIARLVARGSFGAWDRSVLTGRVAAPFGLGRRIPGLAGSADFVGVNYYMRWSAKLALPRFSNVKSAGSACPPGTELTEMGWQVYPPGLFHVLDLVRRNFGKPIWITENGCADSGDEKRRRYLAAHLAQVHRAIAAGCDVRGFLHWTFTDNFEWREGFEKRFGIIAMDPNDPELRRTPKQSAFLLRDVARANALDADAVARHAPGALDPWPLAPGLRIGA
ncbi:beta-glucosidase [Myxococcaceae bacterium]|jgi:beta-glucosidase|nr:beta-glucosidase [Myxococcaceae bacterium]